MDFKSVEKKWQKIWEDEHRYHAIDFSEKLYNRAIILKQNSFYYTVYKIFNLFYFFWGHFPFKIKVKP